MSTLWSPFQLIPGLTLVSFFHPELYSGTSGTSTDATSVMYFRVETFFSPYCWFLCLSRHENHSPSFSLKVFPDVTYSPVSSPLPCHLSSSSSGQCGKTWITTASLIVTLPAVAILWWRRWTKSWFSQGIGNTHAVFTLSPSDLTKRVFNATLFHLASRQMHWLVSPRLLRATILWRCLVLQQVHPGSYALWWCFQLWLCVPCPIQQQFKLYLQLNPSTTLQLWVT